MYTIDIFISTFDKPTLALGAANNLKKYILNYKLNFNLICPIGYANLYYNKIYNNIIENKYINNYSNNRLGIISAINKSNNIVIYIKDYIRLIKYIDPIKRYNKNYKYSSYNNNIHIFKNFNDTNIELYENLIVNYNQLLCLQNNDGLKKLILTNYSRLIDDNWLDINISNYKLTEQQKTLINYIDNLN